MPIFIGIYQKNLFGIYINDQIRVARIFDTIYIFLNDKYFLKLIFGLVYLSKKRLRYL